jgi:hypothetical protein
LSTLALSSISWADTSKIGIFLASSYGAVKLSYPVTSSHPTSFAMCEPGLVFVPVSDGVAVAGWGGWLIEPGGLDAQSISCGQPGQLFAIDPQNNVIELRRVGKIFQTTKLTSLPAGNFQLSAANATDLWIWGSSKDNRWRLFKYDKRGIHQIWSGAGALRAATSVNPGTFLGVDGNMLVMWYSSGSSRVLARLEFEADGVAMDRNSEIFVSGPKGIVKLMPRGKPMLVSVGVHGPLIARGTRLYVLWREQSSVLRLKQRPSVSRSKSSSRTGQTTSSLN